MKIFIGELLVKIQFALFDNPRLRLHVLMRVMK